MDEACVTGAGSRPRHASPIVFLASALVLLCAAGVALHLLRDDQRRSSVEGSAG